MDEKKSEMNPADELMRLTRTSKRLTSEARASLQAAVRKIIEAETVNTEMMRLGMRVAGIPEDAVTRFWYEHRGRFVWDLLPMKFLFSMFVRWLETVDRPRGYPYLWFSDYGDKTYGVEQRGFGRFVEDLHTVVVKDGSRGWEVADGGRVGNSMSNPEPLVEHYGLSNYWARPADPNRHYSGRVLRRVVILPDPQFEESARATDSGEGVTAEQP